MIATLPKISPHASRSTTDGPERKQSRGSGRTAPNWSMRLSATNFSAAAVMRSSGGPVMNSGSMSKSVNMVGRWLGLGQEPVHAGAFDPEGGTDTAAFKLAGMDEPPDGPGRDGEDISRLTDAKQCGGDLGWILWFGHGVLSLFLFPWLQRQTAGKREAGWLALI